MTDEDVIVEHEAGLHKALTRGQITMMGLGGAIDTGLFMSSVIAGGITAAVAVANKTISPRGHGLTSHVGRRGLPGSPGGTVRPTCRSGGLASAFRNAASTC